MSQSLESELDALRAIENSGERMVPQLSDDHTFWEHVYRYAFACRFVKNKRVLDIACGEGYGAAALQKAGAAQVVAIDVSERTCRHSRERYGLGTLVGRAEQIPLADTSVDLVVSFETIEHVAHPLRFLDECARILVPGGQLIVSTPNKGVYSASDQPQNPHHCSEMTEREFVSVLRRRFQGLKLYSQHARWAPWWSPRTLGADQTPWSRFSLFRRLHRSARFRFAPITVYKLTSEQRNRVVGEVIGRSRVHQSIANLYVVRRKILVFGERPTYFVASAIRRQD